jgi:hypothetical protein
MAEPRPHGVHRYRSVTEGVAMANEYLSSRLSISEFARQKGVSFKMVKYWTARARRLAAEAGQGSPSQMEPRDLVAVGSVDEHGVMEPAAPVPAPLRVDAPAAPAAIEIHLGNGVRIAVGPGFSPEVLRSVVACLGASC